MTNHRKKASSNRNGRNRYEKGRNKHQRYPGKLVNGYRGSTKHAPEQTNLTLSEVWPE